MTCAKCGGTGRVACPLFVAGAVVDGRQTCDQDDECPAGAEPSGEDRLHGRAPCTVPCPDCGEEHVITETCKSDGLTRMWKGADAWERFKKHEDPDFIAGRADFEVEATFKVPEGVGNDWQAVEVSGSQESIVAQLIAARAALAAERKRWAQLRERLAEGLTDIAHQHNRETNVTEAALESAYECRDFVLAEMDREEGNDGR